MKPISRREFIRRSGAAGAALFGSRLLPSWGAPKSEFTEALVIGSGFGGAIAALRLAQAGVNVVVLERGRRWPITDPTTNATFATFNAPDGRSSWMSDFATGLIPTPIDRYAGVMELIDPTTTGPIRAQGIAVRNGAGVGGGSLVYNAIMLQPRRELFRQVFPANIDYDEMDSVYYPRVRQILGQSTIPNDILNSPYYGSTRANLLNAQNAGMYPGMPVEFNIDWDIVRDEIAGTKVPSAIAGQSWFGLNSGAKNSVDKNYLKMAEDTGRVEVLPLHVVTDIGESTMDGTYTVWANEITVDGVVVGQKMFTCSHLFLAAGAVGTPALLVKAREKGMLPRLNDHVGRYWGANGDFIALRGGVGAFQPAQGGPCGHILMEDFANPYSPTDLVELVVPSDFEQYALGNAPGFSLYVGLGLAPPVGDFTYDGVSDSVTLNWPHTDSRLDTFSAGVNAMLDRLNAANSGSFTAFNSEDPDYVAGGGPALTAHPVGGAIMGKACDFSGRVHGHQGLYVVDGSLVPGGSCGGVNPSFTIAALAERCMDTIVSRDLAHGLGSAVRNFVSVP
jgi:cholesterol oxidase